MLIVSLKQHFPARWPEWHQSGMALALGAYICLHPDLFTQPGTAQLFAGVALMVSWFGYPAFAVWGLILVTIGFVRAGALFVNGAYTRTPTIRLVMSFLSAFVWTQMAIGFLNSSISNTGIVVYSGLVIMDIVSAYRAAVDVVYAQKIRHDMKQGSNRADISRSFA